jgi:hypothetical protein
MKLYSNSITSILISGCAVCPNRQVKRYKTATGFTSRYECQAITCERLDYSVPGNKLSYHPPVSDAIRQGGFLEDCPLPDALPYTPSISTPVGANGGSPA